MFRKETIPEWQGIRHGPSTALFLNERDFLSIPQA